MKRELITDFMFSAFVGMFVGMLFMVFHIAGPSHNLEVLIALLKSAGIGIFIGCFGDYILFPLIWNLNRKMKYILKFLSYSTMTVLFSLLMGVREWVFLVVMVVIVELLTTSYMNLREKYQENLNKKLMEKKQHLFDGEA